MPETTSGIDVMRRRIERASRQPPPAPRGRPAAAVAPAPPAESPAEPVGEGGGTAAPAREAPPARARRPRAPRPTAERPRLAADLPPVNLAIRVRKPLDDHLAEVIHQLRRDGVRTSKVELIEMLLWEQTDADAAALRGRLAAFRAAAPRGPGAPLEETR